MVSYKLPSATLVAGKELPKDEAREGLGPWYYRQSLKLKGLLYSKQKAPPLLILTYAGGVAAVLSILVWSRRSRPGIDHGHSARCPLHAAARRTSPG